MSLYIAGVYCDIQGMRGAYFLTRVALFIESLGITNFTWLLFACLDGLMHARGSRSHTGADAVEHENDDGNGDDNADRLVNINIELGNRQPPTLKTFSLMSGDGNGHKKKPPRHFLLPMASPVGNGDDSVTV